MFKSYMKIAFRNFRKHKMYATLNIAGLAIGLACCILILFYIDTELSYDRYHEKAERIYRPVTEDFAGSSYLLGQKMHEEIPEVENVVRFRNISTFELPAFSVNNKSFREQNFYAVDPSIFEIFELPFVYGDPKSSLSSPDSLVLTESTAKKYFGPDNPIGKTITYEDDLVFTVTGVIKNLPENSHLSFDILASPLAIKDLSGLDDRFNWGAGNYRTYILLSESGNSHVVEEKIAGILSRVDGPEFVTDASYALQPLTSIHLHSHLRGEFKENGNIRDIYLYSTIGLIILIMACINFINLTSAHSLNRSLEIGVRKVLGATRKQVIRQFIGESVLFAWLALPLALLLVRYSLPFFNNQINAKLSLTQLNSIPIVVILLGFTTLVGVLAGSYPAFFSSSFSPVKGMKRADSSNIK
ncbi:ABC transporter permease, partial [Acidobacteriota bacterium]